MQERQLSQTRQAQKAQLMQQQNNAMLNLLKTSKANSRANNRKH